MRNMLIMLFCGSFVFCGCSKLDVQPQDRFLLKDWLTPEMAKEIAKKHRLQQDRSNRLNGNERFIVSDSIIGASQRPLFYVVNVEPNLGWVIVSGTYRMEPILAYNNVGRFDRTNLPPGLGIWVDNTASLVQDLLDADTIHPNARIGWSSTVNDGVVEDSPEVLNLIRKIIHQIIGANLQCRNPSFGNVEFGPLIITEWGQGCSFNEFTPKCETGGNCGHKLTGCVPTAVGQILTYYGEPRDSFRFNQMSIDRGNSEVSFLLSQLGKKIKVKYGCDGTTGWNWRAQSALRQYGYKSSGQFYNVSKVVNDVISRTPVYLSGCRLKVSRDTISSGCHAWVCDGYRYRYKKCDGFIEKFEKMFHFNWGWQEVGANGQPYGDNLNGWFLINQWKPIESNNYKYWKQMIYDIKYVK